MGGAGCSRLPECDAVEDGGTGYAAADVWDVGDDDDCDGDEGGCV